MNREQRRIYDRRIKKDKQASTCPECRSLARFITTARGEKDTVLICERCNAVVREGEELTKLVPPGIYLPIPLPTLDKMLLAEAARIEEDNNDPVEINEDGSLEVEGSIA